MTEELNFTAEEVDNQITEDQFIQFSDYFLTFFQQFDKNNGQW